MCTVGRTIVGAYEMPSPTSESVEHFFYADDLTVSWIKEEETWSVASTPPINEDLPPTFPETTCTIENALEGALADPKWGEESVTVTPKVEAAKRPDSNPLLELPDASPSCSEASCSHSCHGDCRPSSPNSALRFVCPKCPQRFRQRNHVNLHVASVHLKLKPFDCPHCPRRFGTSSNLRRHVRMVHEKIRPWGCPRCLFKFAEPADMKKHFRRKHPDVLLEDVWSKETGRSPTP